MLLQLSDCLQDLPHLVCLRHTSAVLYVHPRISRPRRAVHPVTAAGLPWWSEVLVTHLGKVGEPDTRRVLAHGLESRRCGTHTIVTTFNDA